jgi:uncharacterized protein (TIGR03435 family)
MGMPNGWSSKPDRAGLVSRRSMLLASFGFSALSGQPQNAAPATSSLVFDVASIKTTSPSFSGTGMQIPRPGNSISMRGWTLKIYIRYAFTNGFGNFLPPDLVVGGPGWLDDDRYDIAAKAATNASVDERKQMLKALLAERCKLAFHLEPRPTGVYVLMVGKKGPRLKVRQPEDGGDPYMIRGKGDAGFICRNTSMGQLATFLTTTSLGRPVIDKTGLSGTFDFDLDWGEDRELPSQGVRDPQGGVVHWLNATHEIGLDLTARKESVDHVIIDHIEKPSEN